MEKMLINKEGDFIFNFCMRTWMPAAV